MIERVKLAKNALWASLHHVCKGRKVVVDDHNRDVLNALAHWLAGEPHTGLEPGKWVGLRGPVGTGKTDTMKALSYAMSACGFKGALRMANAIKVVKEYNAHDGGDELIMCYAERGPLCLDDLGQEDLGRHYGRTANVIGDIIALRYERWKSDPAGYATVGTTNLNNEALRKWYNERTLSRLDEMQVFLPLDGPDRRAVPLDAPVGPGLFTENKEAHED